jgi:RimJ/RimL family protein N-acetyltransferase
MANLNMTAALKQALEALPEVLSAEGVKVEDKIIKFISLETKALGRITVQQLDVDDALALFDFYSEGLSEKPKRLFAPYPLFSTPPASANELASRIADWKKEKDWTVLNLIKDREIIGFVMLKRFYSKQATSAIAVRDEFLKKDLGSIMQNIIIEQAKLLNLKSFHVKIVSDNLASVRLHEKYGFKQTRILPPPIYEDILQYLSERDKINGNKAVDRHIIEMTIDINGQNK